MSRTGQNVIITLGAVFSWLLLWQLLVAERIDEHATFGRWRILFYLLAVLAPLLTFVPIARWARVPFYDIEAVIGWASLVLVVGVVSPSEPPTLFQFLLFLLPLTVALATAGTLVSYLVGLRVYRHDPRRYDFVRARRQGYIMAMVLVAGMLLFSGGTLSPTSAVLLMLVAVLAEMFSLSRDVERSRRVLAR